LKIIAHHPVQAAFFVAPAWGVTGNEFDPIMGEIADQQFDWEAIRNHCDHFEIFHADNDPYLPLERAETLAKHLGCTVTVVKGAGHLNAKAGYKEFSLLLQSMERSFLSS
jgi:predicted alpha/beta hydrolase family esterase